MIVKMIEMKKKAEMRQENAKTSSKSHKFHDAENKKKDICCWGKRSFLGFIGVCYAEKVRENCGLFTFGKEKREADARGRKQGEERK